jgi:hypothetical protein
VPPVDPPDPLVVLLVLLEPPAPTEVLPVTVALPELVAEVAPLEDVVPEPEEEVVPLPDPDEVAPPAPVSPVVALMTHPEAKTMAPIPTNTRPHCDRILFIRSSSIH